MPAERGFTLIEILVVVLIIGITLGFALLAFGDFGASRQATVSAEQVLAYIKLVEQQAIIEGNTLGINVSSGGYVTSRFYNGSWQAMPSRGIFHAHSFSPKVIATVISLAKNNGKNPNIIISPSGQTSPFTINFGTSQKPDVTSLVSKSDGQLVIQQPMK